MVVILSNGAKIAWNIDLTTWPGIKAMLCPRRNERAWLRLTSLRLLNEPQRITNDRDDSSCSLKVAVPTHTSIEAGRFAKDSPVLSGRFCMREKTLTSLSPPPWYPLGIGAPRIPIVAAECDQSSRQKLGVLG